MQKLLWKCHNTDALVTTESISPESVIRLFFCHFLRSDPNLIYLLYILHILKAVSSLHIAADSMKFQNCSVGPLELSQQWRQTLGNGESICVTQISCVENLLDLCSLLFELFLMLMLFIHNFSVTVTLSGQLRSWLDYTEVQSQLSDHLEVRK